MAQNQRQGQHSNQRTKPSKDHQGADKDRHPTPEGDDLHEEGEYKDQHVPLRDPSEGKSPAVIGQDLQHWEGEGDFQDQASAQPQPPVIGVDGYEIDDGERDPGTIAEEQRRRSEEMQEQGVGAWMAARDSRTREQIDASSFVQEEEKPRRGGDRNVVAGGGQFDQDEDEPDRRRLGAA